jgi:hypothetical protein
MCTSDHSYFDNTKHEISNNINHILSNRWMYQWTKPVFGNSTQWFAEVLVSLLSIKVYTVIIYILYDLEKKRLENKSIYVYMVLNLEFHLSLVTVTCLNWFSSLIHSPVTQYMINIIGDLMFSIVKVRMVGFMLVL